MRYGNVEVIESTFEGAALVVPMPATLDGTKLCGHLSERVEVNGQMVNPYRCTQETGHDVGPDATPHAAHGLVILAVWPGGA